MDSKSKLSLWQKLKRLLTSSAPQDSSPADNIDHKDNVSNDNSAIGADRKQPESLRTESAKDDNKNNRVADNINTSKTTKASSRQDFSKRASLSKDSINSPNQTPIIDYLKLYFGSKHWHYTHYKPRISDAQQSHYLSLRMRNRKIDCGYLFRVQEKERLLAVYGILPFLIPESHQSAAMLLMTQLNYDMVVGNLEMDVSDGEIRYKNALDVEVLGLDDDIIEHLLQSVVAMTTVAYEVFSDLLNTQEPSEDMPTLLGELRAQADARTYFLASKKMQ
ncbi:type III secretion system chaperone family protein [Psychrobacter submarinus]|uniref:YbjN domain-containing protein n=1 Tax=Psychrobacter submarinus TaxID=154108 RepID=UPI001919A773|nr:YbjN domain-containing protein [Psychrobacter submarinus]